MTDETRLRDRLAAMESRVAPFSPPPLPVARRHHLAVSLASAVVLVMVFAATAIAGAVVVRTLVTGYPGIENPGQPLEGARMECMTPPQAAAFLAEHGYTDVVWQIETGTPKVDGSTTTMTEPPEHGYVIPGAILDDGKLHMIVDQRPGIGPAGVCGDMPMP